MKPTYAEVAQRCLDRLGQYNLDMSMYRSPSCETSFCMLGDLAHSDEDFLSRYALGDTVSPYLIFSKEKLGISIDSKEWSWLFDGRWSNNITHAKARCQYAIDNGKAPEYSDVRWKYIDEYIEEKTS